MVPYKVHPMFLDCQTGTSWVNQKVAIPQMHKVRPTTPTKTLLFLPFLRTHISASGRHPMLYDFVSFFLRPSCAVPPLLFDFNFPVSKTSGKNFLGKWGLLCVRNLLLRAYISLHNRPYSTFVSLVSKLFR